MRRCFSMLALVVAGACHRQVEDTGGEVVAVDDAGAVEIRSSKGKLLGTLRLIPTRQGSARLVGTLNGLPAGHHAIHAHAVGRCEGPTFETAGGHFNPTGKRHGLLNPTGPHGGDASSIEADATRRAVVDVVLAQASPKLNGKHTLFDADGASVVIHARTDDQMTDPSGNSGARIACGVLRHN